jgi:hypothetical protein
MTDHEAKMDAQSRLRDRIAAAGGHPAAEDVYEHYKGGYYRVVMVGIDEDTLIPRVGYCSQTYGIDSFRTLDNWTEEVEVDGERVPRFRLCGPEEFRP